MNFVNHKSIAQEINLSAHSNNVKNKMYHLAHTFIDNKIKRIDKHTRIEKTYFYHKIINN